MVVALRRGDITKTVRETILVNPTLSSKDIFILLQKRNVPVKIHTVYNIKSELKKKPKASTPKPAKAKFHEVDLPLELPPTKEKAERKSKVFWTEEEKMNILDCAAKLYVEKPCLPLLEYLKLAAVEILPRNRQRKIDTFTTFAWFPIELKKRLQSLPAIIGKANKAEAIEKETAEKLKAAQDEFEAVLDLHREEIISEIPIEALIGRVASKFLKSADENRKLLQSIAQRLDNAPVHSNGHAHAHAHAHAPVLHRRNFHLVVIGLLPTYEQPFRKMLEEKYTHIKLTVIDVDARGREIPITDMALIITKRCSHAIVDKTKSIYAKYSNRLAFTDASGLQDIINFIKIRLEWVDTYLSRG